ncbi:3007_t:CDS:2, partial [Acaulospora colombiana]
LHLSILGDTPLDLLVGFLLYKTNDQRKFFVTNEYSVLRFTILLVAIEESLEAFSAFEKRLPVWDNIKDGFNFNNRENVTSIKDKYISIANNAASIIEFIDFRRIDAKILIDIIEPLDLISPKKLMEAYRFHSYETKSPSHFRGIHCITWDKGTEVIMNLNMNSRVCQFSIAGKKYDAEWINLPSKLYFAAALSKGGKYRIISL